MIIVWSEEARSTYLKIIDYVFSRWEVDIVLEFETNTNNLLDHLKEFKDFCPTSRKQKTSKVCDSQKCFSYLQNQ